MPSIIIIGAGAGVSAAVARRFGHAGYEIGLIARSETSLDRQCRDLAAAGIHAVHETADAGDMPALWHAIDRLTGRLGGCDVAVYNAAVMRQAAPLDLDVDRLKAELSVNLFGALQTAQQVAPAMVARGSGAILFTGGGLGLEPYPDWSSLAMGKAALRNLAVSLYKELAPKGVHVAVITICGIVKPGGPFDPDLIADRYFSVATTPCGPEDREVIIQPPGTDAFYNDPGERHRSTTLPLPMAGNGKPQR